MADIPVKSIADIEVKSEVSDNDKILILDSVSEEARLASKSELKWDKGDTWDTWPQGEQGIQGIQWEKGDKWDTWLQWPQWERWLQGLKWDKGDKWDKWDKGDKGNTWEKWDTWAEIEWVEWIDNDMVFLKNDWTYVTLEWAKDDLKWPAWEEWPEWAKIVSAAFNGNDIDFTDSDWDTITLADAKTELKWDQWDKGDTGNTWPTWPSIVSAAFSGNDIVFTKDDSNTVTLADAKVELKWDKWDTGNTGAAWAAATVTVWSTTTWQAWTSASVTNSGTTSAAVLDFTIPKWDKWDQWVQGEQGEQWPEWNGIASITSSKSGKITTVTITDDDWNVDSFQISDGADWEGSWDVLWPSSATDWHLAVFDWVTWKLIKDWWAIPDAQIQSDWDQSDNTKKDFIKNKPTIPAAQVNSDWNSASWVSQILNKPTLWTAASKNTWTSSWNVPVLDSNGKLDNSVLPAVALVDTFTVANKSDLTSLSSADQWDIWIVTSESKTYVLSVAPYSTAANWKELLTPTDAVTSVNTKTWAVTLNADDISDTSTTNKFVTASDLTNLSNLSWTNTGDQTASDFDIKDLADTTSLRTTWSWKQDALSSQTAYTSKGTSTKVPQISTNSLWQVTGITEVSIDLPWKATSSTTGTVKLWSDTVQSVSANAVSWTASRTYAIQTNSSDQLVVNVPREDHTYTASSFDIKDLADSTSLRTTWSWKQDALSSQTAYTTKWTSTKVATISTNTLWQVTAITETSIDFPVTSVNGSTWAVTVPVGDVVWPASATDGHLAVFDTATGKLIKDWWAVPTGVPSGWTDWQVLSKVSGSIAWANPSWWDVQVSTQANNILTSWTKLRCGTEANYSSLGTYDNNTIYLTI